MNDARDRIRAQMKALEDELSLMTLHSWNYKKIGIRRRALILLQMQLESMDRMEQESSTPA